MNRNVLRSLVGIGVVGTHLVACFGVIVWQSGYIPDSTERLDVALTLIPVSAGYFIAVVRSAIQNQSPDATTTKVNFNYSAIVLLVSIAFCVALLCFVFSYPRVVGPTIVELKRWLVIVEIGFGGGFGLIAEDLFGKVEKVIVERET